MERKSLFAPDRLGSEWLQGQPCVCVCVCVCVFGCRGPIAPESLVVTIASPQGIIEAYKNGDIVLGNTTSMGRWEFVGSFFFSVSTITTIGKRRMGSGRVAGEGGLA